MIHDTKAADAAVYRWVPLDDEWEISAPALIDRAHSLPDGKPLLARLSYNEALFVAVRESAELLSAEQFHQLRSRASIQLRPFLGTPRAENGIEHSIAHDSFVWSELAAAGWDEASPVAGAGKHWARGAPAGRSRLIGWDVDGPGPGLKLWQPDAVAHNREHFDDGTTTVLVRRRTGVSLAPVASPQPPRPTIRKGSQGPHVAFWQGIVGATPDGSFGPRTEALTKAWQAARGLVDDGVVGAKSWRAAGQVPEEPKTPTGGDPRAPACVAALRDANARWPNRKKISDGIMGDPRHQAGVSDHNSGDAVDITDDDASGCDSQAIAEMAIYDARTKYVISNGKIFNRQLGDRVWRKYTGSNPHNHHVHISVLAARRNDTSPWAWAA